MSGVLVVQTAFLGDVILTTPLLAELARACPAEPLTVVTTPPAAELIRGLPGIRRVIGFDKRRRGRAARTLRLLAALRRERFAVAVAAQRSWRTGLLVRASGAPVRIGFAGAAGQWACTHRVAWRGDAHAVRRYLALAQPAGGDPSADPSPRIAVPGEARVRARRALAELGVDAASRFVAVAPGSIWGSKRWTWDGFAAVARALEARGIRVVLVGSGAERELCEQVAAAAGGRPAVLAGRTGLAELAAVLADSRALVGNDSGPGHIAAAVGVPVVTVFGPTVPAFGYAPFGAMHRVVELDGLACRPCHHHGPPECPLGHHRCMVEIGPERVVAALDGLGLTPSGQGTP